MKKTAQKHTLRRTFLGWGVLIALLLSLPSLVPLLVFAPSKSLIMTPAVNGYEYEDVFVTTQDGVKLHGWWVPAPNARAALLFCHGNAGNISYRMDSIKIFRDLGLSVFIFGYRGYGQSEGKPSIDGANLDALAAWQWLTEEKKIPAGKIVLFGRSLGGAVAMELAQSVSPRAMILESTFSSLADMAPFPIPAFLARLLVKDAWNSAQSAAALTIPTLCIHSQGDEIVPYRQGRQVYEAIAGEKYFLEIRGSHNSGFLRSLDVYIPALDEFLTRYFSYDEVEPEVE